MSCEYVTSGNQYQNPSALHWTLTFYPEIYLRNHEYAVLQAVKTCKTLRIKNNRHTVSRWLLLGGEECAIFVFKVLLQNLALLIEGGAREYSSVVKYKFTMFKAPGLIPRSLALGRAGSEQKPKIVKISTCLLRHPCLKF